MRRPRSRPHTTAKTQKAVMSSDLSFEGKGIKGAKEQGVLRVKYDFIAAYELGYADVAFGKFNFACQKGDKRGCHQLGLLYVYAPEPKKIRIRLLRFLSKLRRRARRKLFCAVLVLCRRHKRDNRR